MKALYLRSVYRVLRVMKYSFCLPKILRKYDDLTIEEKCDYVIANYVFVFSTFVFLVPYVFAGLFSDQEQFGFVMRRVKDPVIFGWLFCTIIGSVGRFAHFSLRRLKWSKMPKEEVLSDKISLLLQVMGIFGLIFLAIGFFGV